MKITIEVVGSVFRVEIDNQPETANETLGGTGDDCSHGKGGAWPPQEGASSSLGNDSLRVVTAGETALNSDGGLNIVTKHTEIALASQGEQEAQSLGGELSIVGANAGGGHVTDGGNAHTKSAGAALRSAPASKLSILRPHCKHKDACGGFGFNHCHSCLRGVNAEGSAA